MRTAVIEPVVLMAVAAIHWLGCPRSCRRKVCGSWPRWRRQARSNGRVPTPRPPKLYHVARFAEPVGR